MKGKPYPDVQYFQNIYGLFQNIVDDMYRDH